MKSLSRVTLSGLALGLALAIGAGMAAAAEVIGWEELAPPFDESMDPFVGLTEEQQAALYEFAMSGDLEETDQLDEELVKYRAEARQTLVSAGLDIDTLLAKVDRYEKYAEVWSNTLVDGLNGQDVRMPGYALPLEFSGTTVTEFLLVPYVGACIHTPPPPPNQIVHVRIGGGFESDSVFVPVWVTGRITTAPRSVSLSFVDGSSNVAVGYQLEAASVEPYVPE